VTEERDILLRRAIYRFFADQGRAPRPEDVGATPDDYRRLEAAHAIVTDDDGRIKFSNPFADGPTDFLVAAGSRRWYAICAWDALGILAATGEDGRTRTDCSDCGQAIEVEATGGEVQAGSAIAHFLVPAARWYEDLAHT
jgi:hypothetical protein